MRVTKVGRITDKKQKEKNEKSLKKELTKNNFDDILSIEIEKLKEKR